MSNPKSFALSKMCDITSQLIADEEDDFKSYVENTLLKDNDNWVELIDKITSFYEIHCISGLDYLLILQQCDLDIKKAKKLYDNHIENMIEEFKESFILIHKINDSDGFNNDSDDDFLTTPSKETLNSVPVYKKLDDFLTTPSKETLNSVPVYKKLDDLPDEEGLHLFQLPNMKYVWTIKDGSCYEYHREYNVGKWLGQIKLVNDKDTYGSNTSKHYEIDTSVEEPEYDD